MYLGQKIGDILNALTDLQENGKSMGLRQLSDNAQTIVNQIRRILHSVWRKEDIKNLAAIQKVGVAIMKAIEEKDDMLQVIADSSQELQKVVSAMGTPLNNLGIPEKEQQATTPAKTGVNPPEKGIKPKIDQGKDSPVQNVSQNTF